MSNLALQSERGRMNNGGDGGWVWKTRGGLHRSSKTVALEATVVAAASVTGSAGSNQGTPPRGGREREKRERPFSSFLPPPPSMIFPLHWFLCAWLAWIMEAATTMVVGGGEIMPPIPTKKPRFLHLRPYQPHGHVCLQPTGDKICVPKPY